VNEGLRRVAVVGASLAGLRAAEALRREGFDGELTLVGSERHRPYNRPPLSKQLLAGVMEPEKTEFRTEVEVEWRLGVAATGLDLERRVVRLADGDEVPFDGAVIATGASARAWHEPIHELAGVFSLRELDHALGLKEALEASPRVVVLGAGFIGCEVAAVLRERGLDVTLVDLFAQPMQRVLGEELGRVCAELHAEHGVHLRLGAKVAGIDGADGRVAAVRLEDGESISADVVLVATGAQPNVEWLQGSGLEVRSGVVCDERCQAVGARDVFAAGDVAEFPHPLADGEHVRIEHWSNAGEQGTAAGLNLLRAPDDRVPYTPMPSFWSDQYDVKVQSVGFPHRADTVTVVEGAVADRKFVAACARDGIVVGAIGFSVPRKMLAMRKVVAARTPLADVVAQASSSA
jgi:NADPH-dependent 2,4-dienoyl-CoA reductase/sulfur reductase-like enzyme